VIAVAQHGTATREHLVHDPREPSASAFIPRPSSAALAASTTKCA
jgi:hypothetical protein